MGPLAPPRPRPVGEPLSVEEPDIAGDRRSLEPFGRPTAAELVEAVREHLEETMEGTTEDRARFDARIGRNVLRTVEREIALGPTFARAHADRLAALGFTGNAALAASIRSGAFDHDFLEVGHALAASAGEQLLVANPAYLAPSDG